MSEKKAQKARKSKKVEVKDLDTKLDPKGGPANGSWAPSYTDQVIVQPDINVPRPKP